jgi:hypothetical protein
MALMLGPSLRPRGVIETTEGTSGLNMKRVLHVVSRCDQVGVKFHFENEI